ncbi:MAG: Asp-tRNA(Asn)/Glu-tRNA(Gln) amidotransferase subunit GatC [Candidatus Latescibacteria bacterium]|nr:Asp-tRNA(Asn)/Glu-tRNA(Gln) amidotransferase subunit GatC [bacterium]MBD3425479.1 Asp-tRNA(Asn)/Glu-tRNA(Gln) amidotransferase subunit GatC [Candidatus Latescibacterota bacterium]
MSLSDEEIKHIEKLSRIRLDPGARDKLREQLSDIIDFVNTLQETDTSGYQETPYLERFSSKLRGNTPGGELDHEEVMEQAPDREGGFFRVPPVIDKEQP